MTQDRSLPAPYSAHPSGSDGRPYVSGPGNGFGYDSGTLWPEMRLSSIDDARAAAAIANAAFLEGKRRAQQEICQALGLAQGVSIESPRAVQPPMDELSRALSERDAADRRAGAAEREAEDLRESISARSSWLRKAKQQWGVDDRVSFDVVWAEALQLKRAAGAAACDRDN